MFQPINNDHAIQAVTFSIVFDKAINPVAGQSLRKRRDVVADLPAIQAPQLVEIEVGGAGEPGPRNFTQGIQLAHLRPDGTPAWALRLIGPELSTECTRYTRWDKVWTAAGKYLMAGFDEIAHADRDLKVVVIGLCFVDIFVSEMEEDYNLRELLRPGPSLAEMTFSAGPAWHNHIGWFERVDALTINAAPCLNQLNIDAVRDPNANHYRVQISHNQELRFPRAMELPTRRELDKIMSNLHLTNKTVLGALLTEAMKSRIGL